MSAYEEAFQQAWTSFGEIRRHELDEFMRLFLAALPPSIVVDGKVVELARICHECKGTGVVMVDSMTMYGVPGGWVEDRCRCDFASLLDAAREVAVREEA